MKKINYLFFGIIIFCGFMVVNAKSSNIYSISNKNVSDFYLLQDVNNNCESLFGSLNDKTSPAYFISFAFKIIRYVAIILLIILTILDFISAVSSSDNDIIKKVVNKTIRRMMYCIIIFLLPSLVEFVLKLLYENATMCIGSIK